MRSLLFYVARLPVLLTEAVEYGVRWAAGDDWCRAGLCIVTLFLGDWGLALWRWPIRSDFGRASARCAGWLLCLAWLPLLLWLATFLSPARVAICVAWLVCIFVVLRQGKHLRRKPVEAPEPLWPKRPLTFRLERLDYVSLAVIGVVWIALWVSRNRFLAFPPDSYYHLSVARTIIETGHIPLWDTWSFAPEGRPHLYPPLFHLLIVACSLPFSGDVLRGFQVLQASLFPLSLLCTWYLARWLFNDRRAYLAMLIAGTDLALVTFSFMCTPSALVNVLMLLLLVCFLSKRFILSVLLVVLGLYDHMGVPPFFVGGLLLFSLWQRDYLRFWLGMVACAVPLVLPWYAHVWHYRDWFSNPVDTEILRNAGPVARFFFKLFWMQAINVVMVLLMIRAWGFTKWSEKRNGLLAAVILAFIPMLFSYGARFFIHTFELWSILIAVVFVPFLAGRPPMRRVLAMLALAVVCPSIVIAGVDSKGIPPGPMLNVSGWLLAASGVGGLGFSIVDETRKDLGNLGVREAEDLGQLIAASTKPDQILYVDDDRDTALMLGFFAHRRIAGGAWPEVSPKNLDLGTQRLGALASGEGIFITRKSPKSLQYPPIVRWRHQDGFYLGTAAWNSIDSNAQTP